VQKPYKAPSLVIVAHGSRQAAANAEIARLTERIAAQAGEQYSLVTFGFLEMAEPSIPQAIQSCIVAGAQVVWIMPYFLAAGRHVTVDIPQQVKLKQDEFPDVEIKIMPYLGSLKEIPELLLKAMNG
jgi:sirohydrochlorin ferrochelatase